jgi:transcriptional regulator GlxA family with amidase domain
MPRTGLVQQVLLINPRAAGFLLGRELAELQRLTPPPDDVIESAAGALRKPTGVLPQAMAYIQDHAADPIELADIAEAVGVGRRTLQARFRHHLGTTPSQYLSSVRMARAHADLRAARRGDGQTVAMIAGRWGFTQYGRFASAYRDRYGALPRETLAAEPPR